jgi:hypothetical protein
MQKLRLDQLIRDLQSVVCSQSTFSGSMNTRYYVFHFAYLLITVGKNRIHIKLQVLAYVFDRQTDVLTFCKFPRYRVQHNSRKTAWHLFASLVYRT